MNIKLNLWIIKLKNKIEFPFNQRTLYGHIRVVRRIFFKMLIVLMINSNSSSNNSTKLINFTIKRLKDTIKSLFKMNFLGILYSINYNRLLYPTFFVCFILKTITTIYYFITNTI